MTGPPLDEKAIFNAARQLGSAEARRAYVEVACRDDGNVRERVEALLRILDEDKSFLSSPAEAFRTAFDDPIAEAPGTVIGPYKLLEQIGEGGFGVVFLAEQQQPIRRQVALKVIKPGMDTRQVIARFEAERQALALMDHPNIARVFDAGTTDSGRPYFVMELVRGDPITEYCDRDHLPVSQRLELFVHACHAVQHAHQKGIIHRDIKPSNVLVTLQDGAPVVKIIDFGIAKAMDRKLTDKTLFTEFAALIGTPLYMSPEQVELSGLDIDTRADIYALGVVLYELLTGTTPFDRQRLQTVGIDEIRRIIREEEPPKPSTRIDVLADTIVSVTGNRQSEAKQLRRLLRGELDWIVMKCLEKDRTRRYATANGLARDIQRYTRREPVEAGPPSAWYKLRKFARKNRKLLGVASLFALLLTAGIIVSSWLAVRAIRAEQVATTQRDRAEAETRRAVRQLYAAHINLAQSAWEEAQPARAVQLLERYRPKSADEDLRGFEWYYLRRLTDTAIRTLQGHGRLIWSVAFSSDGKRLASISEDGTLRVWDAAGGREILRLAPGWSGGGACGVAFSPNGKWLATGSAGKTAKVWDATSGQQMRELEGHTGPVVGVAFSPDGQLLATASHDRTVKLWDTATWREARPLRGHGDLVFSVAFSTDGKRLASTGKDRTVRVWDTATGQQTLIVEKAHADEIYSVAFSPDGGRLASAGWDRTVRIWDAASGRKLLDFQRHRERVFSVAFSPDGKRLASGSFDRTVKVWDANSGDEILDLIGHTQWVSCVAFSPDGRRLASSSYDQTVKIWDAAPGQEPMTVMMEYGRSLTYRGMVFNSVAFSANGERLATGGDDPWVRVWDAASGQKAFTLRGHKGNISRVAFSPDGKWLASASVDKTVKIWDASTCRKLLDLTEASGPVWSVAFSPDSKRLAAASEDQTVRVWNAASGQEMLRPRRHLGAVWSVAFSPDGKQLASGGADGTIKLWDVETGQEIRNFKAHGHRITSLVFSPDGNRLASGGDDPMVKLWDAASGEEMRMLEGHASGVASLAFSPDGKRLASAGADRTVKLWDVVSGQETLTFKGHRHNVVSGVAFSPDGQRLASSSYDGTVRIWDARPWTPPLRIEQRARSLIRSLYADLRSKTKVIERINQDAALEPEVRQEALEMAKRWQVK